MATGFEDKKTTTEQLQDSIKEVIVVVEKLTPFCKDFDEMLSLLQEAVKNEAQARLLLKVISGKG